MAQHETPASGPSGEAGVKDAEGAVVRAGDFITFAYGSPPVAVDAEIVEERGRLVALTPGHKPEKCRLDQLRKHVGDFWKIDPIRRARARG